MPSSPRTVAVLIPARYGSARFPGKPLAELAGKPLIQHVFEAVKGISHVSEIQVVTDDSRILQTVQRFGGQACLIESPCRTGTDRIAKAASHIDCEVVVNLQGDEIPLHPGLLSDLIEPFLKSNAQMGTLKRPLKSMERVNQPSVVKVVTNHAGEALYFSRSPIPCLRDGNHMASSLTYYMHLGIYIFRRETLLRFAELPTGVLEEAEKLEQLRALEHGIPIQVWETQHPSLRIDQVADLREASEILSNAESFKFQVSSFRS
jgi:3-deoxy-manno-octulosonate cytidylyltransferase (CMP-KDO synthetase)